MKRSRLTEVIISTILILSIAAGYRYYKLGGMKATATQGSLGSANNKRGASEKNTAEVLVNNRESKIKREMSKKEFDESQITDLDNSLSLYGSEKEGAPIQFDATFYDFHISERFPVELLKGNSLMGKPKFDKTGVLLSSENCVADVKLSITNVSEKEQSIYLSGMRIVHLDENNNEYSPYYDPVFFLSGADNSSDNSQKKLQPGEKYMDTVFFIIKKIPEGDKSVSIKIFPIESNTSANENNSFNNSMGIFRIKYSDIQWN